MEREDQVGFNTSVNHLIQLRESMFIIRKVDVLSKSFQYHESILINVFFKKNICLKQYRTLCGMMKLDTHHRRD